MAKDEEDDDMLPDKDAAKEFYAKYEPKEILGRGISSTVRRCIEKETGREYAAKIIDLGGAATEAGDTNPLHILEATRQEISILRQVMGHPYIIELQDVFESDSFVFLVFELCSKGELFDHLTSVVTLSEKKTRTIMRQIFEGVEYIHSKNIVHRDLKPENILLDDNHNIKITDFGFARQLNDNEMLTDLCGTPGYLAPETLRCNMFEGAPGYGREVDIWACGVIMFTLLVGCPPFWHRKQMVMLRNIMEGKYSFTSPEWADISEEPKDLIRKCLVVDPAKRIKIREVLRHSFFNQMLFEQKIDELKSSLSERSRKMSRITELALILLPELSYDGQKTTYHLCEQNIHSLREYSKYIKTNHSQHQTPMLRHQQILEATKKKLPNIQQQQQQLKKHQYLLENTYEKQQQFYVEYNSTPSCVQDQKQTTPCAQGQFGNSFTAKNNRENNSLKDYLFIAPSQPAPKAKVKLRGDSHNLCYQYQHEQQQYIDVTTMESSVTHDNFFSTEQLRSQNRFDARKTFQLAIIVVRACVRIKRLHYTAEPLHIEDAIRDPYKIKLLRKIIDGCAFHVYSHWVQKGEGQNRAALFENTPRMELQTSYLHSNDSC